MAHGDAREGKWGGNWRMECVASTLHTTSEHGVSSITTAYANTSATSSRLNWRPHRFKWTRPFRRKTKFGFCACAVIFQLASTTFTRAHTNDVYSMTVFLFKILFIISTRSIQMSSNWLLSLTCYKENYVHASHPAHANNPIYIPPVSSLFDWPF